MGRQARASSCLSPGVHLRTTPKLGVPLCHPWLAFRFGNGWSRSNRLSHDKEYVFGGSDEPLVKFAEQFSSVHDVDYFIFGHYHASVDMTLASGSRLLVLKDWIHSSPYICFDGQTIV